MPKVNTGTTGSLGTIIEGLKGFFTEDNGNASATRLTGYGIVGLIVEDVGVRGNPLTLFHVILFGTWILAKAISKFAEKPAQGVVNQKALEHLINKAVEAKGKDNPIEE